MNKFKEILNHYKDNIYGGGREVLFAEKNGRISCVSDGKNLLTNYLSINDLLSPDCGFVQAVFGTDWSEIYRKDFYEDNVNAFEDIYDNENGILKLPRWKYHAMRLSILSQEEKIKYLEDNIIIDEN